MVDESVDPIFSILARVDEIAKEQTQILSILRDVISLNDRLQTRTRQLEFELDLIKKTDTSVALAKAEGKISAIQNILDTERW